MVLHCNSLKDEAMCLQFCLKKGMDFKKLILYPWTYMNLAYLAKISGSDMEFRARHVHCDSIRDKVLMNNVLNKLRSYPFKSKHKIT